jgi:hypothetical protein
MPHRIANTYCEKLHQLGERVELFLFGSDGSRGGQLNKSQAEIYPACPVGRNYRTGVEFENYSTGTRPVNTSILMLTSHGIYLRIL